MSSQYDRDLANEPEPKPHMFKITGVVTYEFYIKAVSLNSALDKAKDKIIDDDTDLDDIIKIEFSAKEWIEGE